MKTSHVFSFTCSYRVSTGLVCCSLPKSRDALRMVSVDNIFVFLRLLFFALLLLYVT